MNRKQWIAFAVVFYLMSLSLMQFAFSWNPCPYDITEFGTMCAIKAQSYFIPGVILLGLGIIFSYCAWFEPKNKHLA